MNNKNYIFATVAFAVLTACSDSNEPDINDLSDKEAALKTAVEAFVDNTVLPTYKGMADAAVELYKDCKNIQDSFNAGNLTSSQIETAGNHWKQSRKCWELSEAFLFGPASNHNIDPHIDSWPLDKAAMDDLLAQIRAGRNWSIDNNGGYGLLGFHSLEYLLFELTLDENQSKVHSANYTKEELEYMVAIAEDLMNQSVCLEACWAGTSELSSEKQQILADADIDYGEQYGREMKNAGSAGSRFKTYQAAAEEIIAGCISIADEVGNTKIGRPHQGSSEEDKNYIESPYSLNSIEDFVDNIMSIKNSYCGSVSGDPSISNYIASRNKELDRRVRDAIDDAISCISAIPEPFAKSATGAQAAKAMEAAGTTLANILAEVNAELGKH